MANDVANPEIISRKAARAAGLTHYFTGKPCKHGHISKRAVGGGNCLSCQRDWGHRNMARIVARVKVYRSNNPDKVKSFPSYNNLERMRAWRAANAESLLLYLREWRASNRPRTMVYARNRSAKLREGGRHTYGEIQEIFEMQGGRCACCRSKLVKFHVDHIEPVSKGGHNGRRNLQILCPFCNLSKHDRDPMDFMRSRGMLL
jgi:hypothetical protein